jgi:hypothetical protein
MKGRMSGKLLLIGLAAPVCALAVAAQVLVGAVSGDLVVESADVAPGDEGTVTVTADTPSPGLGAWTVDVIVEDPSVIEILECDVPSHSVCNADYPGDQPTVRFAGAVAMGLVGETEIGTITFRCNDDEGSTVLNLSTAGFADATIGGPQEIAVTHSPGTIRCTEEAEEPTEEPGDGATPTVAVGGLPEAGSGAGNGSSATSTVAAVLAVAGLAILGGYGALRMRTRRS